MKLIDSNNLLGLGFISVLHKRVPSFSHLGFSFYHLKRPRSKNVTVKKNYFQEFLFGLSAKLYKA